MERPDLVSLVIPPSTTIPKTEAEQPSSQYPTGLLGCAVGVSACGVAAMQSLREWGVGVTIFCLVKFWAIEEVMHFGAAFVLARRKLRCSHARLSTATIVLESLNEMERRTVIRDSKRGDCHWKNSRAVGARAAPRVGWVCLRAKSKGMWWHKTAQTLLTTKRGVKILPPVVPLNLQKKLTPTPTPTPRKTPYQLLPKNMKRKIREQTYQKPLEQIVEAFKKGPQPFRVARSRMGNLPVYSSFRSGGSKIVTQLRKYAGDVDALADELRKVTGKTVLRYHGRLEVRGRHNDIVKEWLTRIGM